ncbi:hypothetical protein, partial [Stenotrophomonas maltophilia]|uniref:hypothetical protein n=1 Tax=Stenotrophomonas maltophilia TaxID=40324 RepID=UPI0013DA251A
MRIGGASIASDFSISKAYGIYSLGLLGVFALATLAAFPVTLVLVDIQMTQRDTGLAARLFAAIVGIAGYLTIFGVFWVSKQLLV